MNQKKKPWAGERVPSMKRRADFITYKERRFYMITIAVQGRKPLLGTLCGGVEQPHVQLTELGEAVKIEWEKVQDYHPEVTSIAVQIMPDHLHGILFVTDAMDLHLGHIIQGFKSSCNKHYRRIFGEKTSQAGCNGVAAYPTTTPTTCPITSSRPIPRQQIPGLLFEWGYNDLILYGKAELQRWIDYLSDNPRRLATKRANPQFFTVHHEINFGGKRLSAIGNLFLLKAPRKVQVRCSQRLTDKDIEAECNRFQSLARQGAVMVSPCISCGEKAVMRMVFEAGFPAIVVRENGFTSMSKPHGELFNACAKGKLLLISERPHHDEQIALTREICNTLNALAKTIAESKP